MIRKVLLSACFVLSAVLLWGAPTISITYPVNNGKVGGIVTVKAGTVNTVKVLFYKGATLIGTDTVAPFTMNFNFNADAANASYTIKAVAYDSANVTATKTITVRKPNVNNQ